VFNKEMTLKKTQFINLLHKKDLLEMLAVPQVFSILLKLNEE